MNTLDQLIKAGERMHAAIDALGTPTRDAELEAMAAQRDWEHHLLRYQTEPGTTSPVPNTAIAPDLERKIATERAISDIESHCGSFAPPFPPSDKNWWNSDKTWWNTEDSDPDECVQQSLADAIRYLEAHGRIFRHPIHPHIIRILRP